MTKRFEAELSNTLKALGIFAFKPPDSPYTVADRIDFYAQTIDTPAVFMALEAKETTAKETLPWKDVTENQRRTLEQGNRRGLGLLVVNFHRSHDPTVRRSGVVGVYRWPFLEIEDPTYSGTRLRTDLAVSQSLRLADADYVVEQRDTGSVWLGLSRCFSWQWWARSTPSTT